MLRTLPFVFALAACATPPDPILWSHSVSPVELCEQVLTGRSGSPYKYRAGLRVEEQKIDCMPLIPLIQSRIAARSGGAAADAALGLALIQAGRPRAAPMQPSTQCRSFWRGTYWQTVCD